MQPLVSVIIPCYAQAHFLADAVQSVLAQSYPAVELIVVNDGSPDAGAMAEVLAPVLERIVYIEQENGGLSAARNAGLAQCRGEYAVFLDADDRLLPNALADGAAALTARPDCGLVWGRRHCITAAGDCFRRDVNRIGTGDEYIDLLRTNIVGPPVGVMWRVAPLRGVAGFDPACLVAEDYDAYLRIALRYRLHFHGATVAEYRVHAAGMSSNNSRMMAGVLHVYDRQAPWVANSWALRRALRMGRSDAGFRYDWLPRIGELARQLNARHWRRSWRLAFELLARHPGRFVWFALLRVPRISWRLLRGQLVFVNAGGQEGVSSAITAPSPPDISTPSLAANVGARSSIETDRPS